MPFVEKVRFIFISGINVQVWFQTKCFKFAQGSSDLNLLGLAEKKTYLGPCQPSIIPSKLLWKSVSMVLHGFATNAF